MSTALAPASTDMTAASDDAREDTSKPSTLDAEGQFRILKSWWQDDSRHSELWRKHATEDFDFVAGKQFTTEDEQALKDSKRVPVVFNRALTMIKAVAGMEINGRHEISYLPRNNADSKVNEVLTGASKWMADECDGEDEESEAFENMLISGMGWCLSDDAMVRLPKTHFATTRLYSGNVIEVELENGKKLTGTPNHPVLTDMGWKPLHSLREGDNLIRSAFLQRVDGFPVEDFDHVETRLKDRIDAFRRGCDSASGAAFATRANDFYGDGGGSEVHVVYADSPLLRKFRNAARLQHGKKLDFVLRNLVARFRTQFLSSCVPLHPMQAAECFSTVGVGHAPCAKPASFKRQPQSVSSNAQSFSNRFSVQAHALTNFVHRHAFGEVKTNKIFQRDSRPSSPLMLAQFITSGMKSRSDHRKRYSELIADFCDWKPLLEIEARKLGRGNVRPAPEFVTRVLRRVISPVVDFAVHDVGTSLGMFVAGDIVTSNTEHRICFEEEPEGMYIEEAINPLEMFWDRTCKKKNLKGARRITRVRKMPLGDAMSLFPDHTAEELDAVWAQNTGSNEPDKTLEERRVRDENVTDFPDRSEVTIVQTQWWEREVYWLIADPQTNTKAQLPDAQYKILKKRAAMIGLKLYAVRMQKRVYKQAFLGSKVLECGDGPIPDRFSFNCVTGQINYNKGTWFGIVRVLRDPAMWANKFLVQTMHIMNSNAKGGIMAEPDAFEDQAQAEASYARPEAITWLKKGAMSSANPKWAKKPSAEMPQGFIELMGVAVDAMKDVTGINLELLGLKDINQPGVLEAQRKQAGMTVLATMFDSLRRSRKMIGKIRLYFIQNFLSDGRLIRITGPDGAQVIPLVRDKTLGEYNVEVDDTPSSPNQKQMNWAIIQPMLVTFKDQLVSRPDIFGMLLDYSPLPSRVVEAVKAAIMQPNQQQLEGSQLAKEKTEAEIAKDVSIAQMNDAKAGATQATAMYDFAMAKHMLAKAVNEGAPDDSQHPLQPHLDAAHTAAQIGTEQAKADQIRAQTGIAAAQAPADIAQAGANTAKTHADAHASRIGALIDALQPIAPHPPMPAATSLQ